MSDKSNKYGYVGVDIPAQSFGNNKGVFNPAEINDLVANNQWTTFGQLELIETQTVSASSTADFTSIQESTYNVHFITITLTDTSQNHYIGFRFYESSVLETASVYQEASLTNGSEVKSTARDRIICSQSNLANKATNLYAYFYSLGDSTKYSFTTYHGTGEKYPDGAFNYYFGSGVLPQTSAVNGIQVLPNQGNMTGTISLYGIRYS